MRFDPDPNRLAQEMKCNRQKAVSSGLFVYFNNTPVHSTITHKHLEIILDSKLSHKHRLQSAFTKTIRLLRNLQLTLPKKYLVTIYKYFIRSHLDYMVTYLRSSR